MAQQIKQGNIFGRIGTGFGRGLAEQIPKEVERNRLASGLEKLGQQKDLSPFEQFTGLVKAAHEYPQIVQSGSDLLRQQAIINSTNQRNQHPQPSREPYRPFAEQERGPTSATTTASTKAALEPYIPPSGPEQEDMARRLMASDPLVYPNIESARNAISSQVAGNAQQSNARIAKRDLENSVQTEAEGKLANEIKTVGANLPGTVLSKLQQRAVDDVRTGKLSADEAKVHYGKEAVAIDRNLANIRALGGLDLITRNPKDVTQSMQAIKNHAKEYGYQKEAADSMIADNNITPEFSYANIYPVRDVKPLNEEIKSLPDIKPTALESLKNAGMIRLSNEKSPQLTLEAAPRLAKTMGFEGSPLSIAYELEKKGYDPQVWKQYLLDNQENLNLTDHQKDELGKAQPGFFGRLNDWFLSSFSGVK